MQPPDRLLLEEDVEAVDNQHIEDAEGDDPTGKNWIGRSSPMCRGDELDLVRVYLSHVGKRKLLKAREEQELGLRIETARGEVQGALAPLPCAVQTLVSLADHVRAGTSPAAELILLPDGGELRPDNIDSQSSRRSTGSGGTWRESTRPAEVLRQAVLGPTPPGLPARR